MNGGLPVCVVAKYERMDDQGNLVATDEAYSHVMFKHKGEWQIDSVFSGADPQPAYVRASALHQGIVKPNEKLPDGLVNWASWL